MISSGQPINDDLKVRKFADLQARREPDMNSTGARAGWDGDELSGWIDPIAAKTKLARPHDIKIDESQRVFVLPTADGPGARAALFAAALITASGLTWLVISALPSPFASTSVGRSGADLNPSLKFLLPARAIVFRFPIRLFVTRGRQPAARHPWRLLHSNPNLRPTNGTAVLEGPSGTWHVTRGDTVPGVGKIVSIFRWGNRLMVATSGGLISAP